MLAAHNDKHGHSTSRSKTKEPKAWGWNFYGSFYSVAQRHFFASKFGPPRTNWRRWWAKAATCKPRCVSISRFGPQRLGPWRLCCGAASCAGVVRVHTQPVAEVQNGTQEPFFPYTAPQPSHVGSSFRGCLFGKKACSATSPNLRSTQKKTSHCTDGVAVRCVCARVCCVRVILEGRRKSSWVRERMQRNRHIGLISAKVTPE